MTKYTVWNEYRVWYSTEVEADSVDEARQKAFTNDPSIEWEISFDCIEATGVDEVTDGINTVRFNNGIKEDGDE